MPTEGRRPGGTYNSVILPLSETPTTPNESQMNEEQPQTTAATNTESVVTSEGIRSTAQENQSITVGRESGELEEGVQTQHSINIPLLNADRSSRNVRQADNTNSRDIIEEKQSQSEASQGDQGGWNIDRVIPPEIGENGKTQWLGARDGKDIYVTLSDFSLYTDTEQKIDLKSNKKIVELSIESGSHGIALYKEPQNILFNGVDIRLDFIPGFSSAEFDPIRDDTKFGVLYSDRDTNLLKPEQNVWRGFAVELTPLSSEDLSVEIYENSNAGRVLTDQYTIKTKIISGSTVSLYLGVSGNDEWTLYINGRDRVIHLPNTDRYTFYNDYGHISLFAKTSYPENWVLSWIGMNGGFVWTDMQLTNEPSQNIQQNAFQPSVGMANRNAPRTGLAQFAIQTNGLNVSLVLALAGIVLIPVALFILKPWQLINNKELW